MFSSRTDVLQNAFQKKATGKIKMKRQDIYTIFPEGDGGSASLSLLYQGQGDTELFQKTLEQVVKDPAGKTKESHRQESLSYTPSERQR